jgi:hypothetical protein
MHSLQSRHVRHPIQAAKTLRDYLLTKPHRIEWIAGVARTLIKVREPAKWVFVVGCYNSGTTLLSRLLATHSTISRLDEGAFKTNQLTTPEELGWPRLWCQVVDRVRLKTGDEPVDAETLKKDWMLFFDRRKTVFLEKSIVNSARMTWLQQHFPNSYFLFIVRNGYAVAEGIRRQTSKRSQSRNTPSHIKLPYSIELCAKQWLTNNSIVESDAKDIRHFKRIFYEEFCDRPYQTMSDIYAFLGLNDESSIIKDVRHWRIHEYDSEIRNMNGKSLRNLSAEDIKKVDAVAGKMLTQYGYTSAGNGRAAVPDALAYALTDHTSYRC